MQASIPAPYLVVPNFLSAEEHAALLHFALAHEGSFETVALADGSVDRKAKYVDKLWHVGPLRQVFKARIKAGYEEWISRLQLTPFALDHLETHIAAYPDGAHFPFHLDASIAAQTKLSTRSLTGVYYFHHEPKGFSGGEIRLYDLGQEGGSEHRVTIAPTQNTLLVFPSWVGHDVTQVSVPSRQFIDSRFAVNCWLHRPG